MQLGRFKIPSQNLTFPQNEHVYLECCETSIFLTVLRKEAP
jgi:hypothetical protein